MDDPCVDDDDHDEDSCLDACLVDTFLEKAGCLHPRLKVLLDVDRVDPSAKGRGDADVCNHNQLSNLLTRNVQAEEADEEGNEIDPGVSLIKRILNGFSNTTAEEARCGCQSPCVRRHIQINRWKDYNHTREEGAEAVINVDQRFFHYKDTATFDFVKMVADLGGYLGLMLGYSAYSIADFIDYLWHLRKQKASEKIEPT